MSKILKIDFLMLMNLTMLLFIGIAIIIFLPVFKTTIVLNFGNVILIHSLKEGSIEEANLNWILEKGALSPDNYKMQRLLGIAHASDQQNHSAIENLSNAQALEPKDSITKYWLALSYEKTGDYENTLALMHEIGWDNYFPSIVEISEDRLHKMARELMDKPVSALAQHRVAIQLFEIDEEITLALFGKAYKNSPSAPVHSLGVAWFYFNKKEYDLAKQFGDKARAEFPDNLWVNLFFGTFYRVVGNSEMAQLELERIINNSPTDDLAVLTYVEMAKIALDYEDYVKTVDYLNIAEQIDDKHFAIYLIRAQAYSGLEKCDLAKEQLRLVIDKVTSERQQSYSSTERLVEEQCS